MSFTIFQNEKTLLQAVKTRSLKSPKIGIFPKGITHGYVPKMAIFATFFLGNIGQENVFTIFQNEKMPFQALKRRRSKSKKKFPKGLTHGFGIKIGIFRTFFFKVKQARKMFIYDILVRKNASLGFKNTRFKKSENSHFSNGVNPWFWSKNCHFSNFFFQAIQARKISFTIL